MPKQTDPPADWYPSCPSDILIFTQVMEFIEGIIHSLETERFPSVKLCVAINLSQDVVDVILKSHHFPRHMALLFCVHWCVELEESSSISVPIGSSSFFLSNVMCTFTVLACILTADINRLKLIHDEQIINLQVFGWVFLTS